MSDSSTWTWLRLLNFDYVGGAEDGAQVFELPRLRLRRGGFRARRCLRGIPCERASRSDRVATRARDRCRGARWDSAWLEPGTVAQLIRMRVDGDLSSFIASSRADCVLDGAVDFIG